MDIAYFENKETLDLISRVKKDYVPRLVSAFATTIKRKPTVVCDISSYSKLWAACRNQDLACLRMLLIGKNKALYDKTVTRGHSKDY